MPHPLKGWTPTEQLTAAEADDARLFHARTGGLLEWLCPFCLALNRSTVDRALGRVQCHQLGCRRMVGVGVLLLPAACLDLTRDIPPFNARFVTPRPAPDGGFYQNDVLGDAAERPGQPAVARLSGVVEWRCRTCAGWNAGYAGWLSGMVTCLGCRDSLRVAALLHDVSQRRRRVPSDWYGVSPILSRASRAEVRRQRQARGREKLTWFKPKGSGGTVHVA